MDVRRFQLAVLLPLGVGSSGYPFDLLWELSIDLKAL